MSGDLFGNSSCTTPLSSSSNNLIFSEISTGGVTSSLTAKANFYFVSFDSTKNSSRLHMDMNFGFFSFVDFRISGSHENSCTFPIEYINILFTSVDSINIVLPWSPKEYDICQYPPHHKQKNLDKICQLKYEHDIDMLP